MIKRQTSTGFHFLQSSYCAESTLYMFTEITSTGGWIWGSSVLNNRQLDISENTVLRKDFHFILLAQASGCDPVLNPGNSDV